jgi:glycerol uptake facilitator-like aquaporin
MFSKRRVAALAAEFLGTGILAFIVLTISRSQIGIPYFVAIAAGLAVAMLGVALQRDVHLNPALTVGLWTARRVSTVKAILMIVAQLLGGLAAYSLYKYFSRGQMQQPPTTYEARILVAEAVGAFVFTFIAVGAAYQRLHWLVRAVVAGAGLTLGIMVASAASAGFINPAVALANNAWGWSTYVLGPVLGAIIGVNLYGLLFAPKDRDLVPAKDAAVKTTVSTARETLVEKKTELEEADAADSQDVRSSAVSVRQSKSETAKKKKKTRK